MTAVQSFALCLVFTALQLVNGAAVDPKDLLWPLPQTISFSGTPTTLMASSFTYSGSGAGGKSPTLIAAFERYMPYIFDHGRNNTGTGAISQLSVKVTSADETLGLDTSEDYSLAIAASTLTLESETIYGAIKGLETLSQLVYYDGGNYYIVPGHVSDSPRFNYRGFLIDTARHYIPVKVILIFLDAMSFNKMNVLHWHIVDDQSFPYVSAAFPNLSKEGAYDQNHLYTPEDVKNIIAYAKDRGIRVIPEFDTPGHSLSWGKGQPGLSTACYDKSTGKPNGQYGPIDPTNEENWTFLSGLFKELATVFTDQYIHLGGDEVSFACWASNPNINKWMEQKGIAGDYDQLEQYYATQILNLVGGLGKSYIVWQEIFDNGLKVKPDTVVEVWIAGKDSRANITKAGLKAIFSSCWYLNYIGYGADWGKYYTCDPWNFDGTPEQKKLVVGGEACMWGEFVDGTNLISRAWPRASAVAERLWSAQNVTDINDATTRLHNHRCRMITRGIRAEPFNGPSFCPTEWSGTK